MWKCRLTVWTLFVILGARGDLAKLGTISTLVGLVERGVLDVPVVGVARSGWGLDEFRGSAASLRPNGMDPPGPAAEAQSGLVSEHPARTCSYRSTSRRTNLFRTQRRRPPRRRCHRTDVPAQIAAARRSGPVERMRGPGGGCRRCSGPSKLTRATPIVRTEGEDPMLVYDLSRANPQLLRPVHWSRLGAGS